jgi:translation initiation factor IF-2
MVRMSDLARELGVSSKGILDALPNVGVTEKKTHSSSLEDRDADKVRAYIRDQVSSTARPKQIPARRLSICRSHISKPRDVSKAITGDGRPGGRARIKTNSCATL